MRTTGSSERSNPAPGRGNWPCRNLPACQPHRMMRQPNGKCTDAARRTPPVQMGKDFCGWERRNYPITGFIFRGRCPTRRGSGEQAVRGLRRRKLLRQCREDRVSPERGFGEGGCQIQSIRGVFYAFQICPNELPSVAWEMHNPDEITTSCGKSPLGRWRLRVGERNQDRVGNQQRDVQFELMITTEEGRRLL